MCDRWHPRYWSITLTFRFSPPTTTMPTIVSLPTELMRKVTDLLDPVDHVSFRAASKELWATRDHLPRLNADESVLYHLRYERNTQLPSGEILSIVCTYCKRLRSRQSFDDIMRKNMQRRTRHCITCGIYHFNTGKLTKGGITKMACRGCYKIFRWTTTTAHWIEGRSAREKRSAVCETCWKKLFRGRQKTPE